VIMGHFNRGLGATASAKTHSTASGPPVPIPASQSAIFLPADQYLHRGAPTEWWWHIGTLKSGSRTFGFEINATAHGGSGYGFAQVMLTDVSKGQHYQRTTLFAAPIAIDVANWAEHDVTKDWHVGLGSPANYLSAIEVTNPGSGYASPPVIEIIGGGGSQAIAYATVEAGMVVNVQVMNPGRGYTSAPTISISGGGGTGAAARAVHSYITMDAAWGDPTKNMAVVALFHDHATGAKIHFDLMMSQQGPPFLVWGTGVKSALPPSTGTHLQTNNYYYSLTKIDASGALTIDDEKYAVRGTTWMDHEYGYFGTPAHPVRWVLQDAQLDNGWTLSNYCLLGDAHPTLNKPVPSTVTLQAPDGAMFTETSILTPVGRTWVSPVSGTTYFMEFQIDIPSFQAKLDVSSLLDSQEFPSISGPSVYEGVAGASGTFSGKQVSGTAWIEEAL
jgi:predicted secreted hydrolase